MLISNNENALSFHLDHADITISLLNVFVCVVYVCLCLQPARQISFLISFCGVVGEADAKRKRHKHLKKKEAQQRKVKKGKYEQAKTYPFIYDMYE